jgi:hypothetical protein
MRKGLWLGMRSPFSAEIVSSRNLTLVHRREHINEVQSGTTKALGLGLSRILDMNIPEHRY